jgi:hypothetical protein
MSDRVWSPSAIVRYRSCPLAWRLSTDGTPRDTPPGVVRPTTPAALGGVAHAGLATAYTAARDDEDQRPGRRMAVFTPLALRAVDRAWHDARLPFDSPERFQVASEVVSLLDRLPCPHPAAVLAVEEELPMTGPSGTRFRVIPDLVLRVGVDSVHVRDWKRRAVSSLGKPADLVEDDQLAAYVRAVFQRWPWVRRVSVGLFSVTGGYEVVLEDFPEDAAAERVRGHEVTAYAAEHAGRYPATPDGTNCTECAFRSRCPAVGGGGQRDYRLVR